jgi:23S rRNA-/tRNA-specific pseudouridylate synthase
MEKCALDEEKLAEFKVLYRNPELIVIDKPHNVAMDGDYPPEVVTVERWVAKALGDYLAEPLPSGNCGKWNGGKTVVSTQKALRFVHQLDRGTSGILCLAFSKEMAARMAHCFQQRYAHKTYVALLSGWLDPTLITLPGEVELVQGTLKISSPVGYDETDGSGLRMCCVAPPVGKTAETVLETISTGYILDLEGKESKCTLVNLHPSTGRRHQLRVHCQRIGFPIVGDDTYSADGKLFSRLMLHALKLQVEIDVEFTEESYKDRVVDRKRRRRETLGFADHCSTSSTVFESENPLLQYFRVKSNQ